MQAMNCTRIQYNYIFTVDLVALIYIGAYSKVSLADDHATVHCERSHFAIRGSNINCCRYTLLKAVASQWSAVFNRTTV